MAEQVSFVADQEGMLFLALVQADDGFGDLAHQVATAVSRFEIQFTGQLAQQVQGGSGSPVQVEDLEQTGVEGSDEGAGGGGLAGSDFKIGRASCRERV